MMRKALPLVLPVLLALSACDAARSAEEPEIVVEAAPPLQVYAGNHPLAYFAERVGGERVAVELPVPAGVDPADWFPGPEVVLGYQGADLILLNGAEYEAWVPTATLPAARVVDTSARFAEEIIFVEDAVTHSHGPEGEHSHGETASTTWLDLGLAVRQAEAVRDGLIAAEPGSAEAFRERFGALESDLRELDARLRAVASASPGAVLLGATPVYQYLERYGFDVRSLRFDRSDPLSRSFWHDLEHAVSASRTMLWPSAPPPEARERLDAMGVRTVVFDPAGGRPAEGDFLTVMRANLQRLEAALGS